MIRKKLIAGRYIYYDNEEYLFDIDLKYTASYSYTVIYKNNSFDILHNYMDISNMKILYEFKPLIIISKYNNIEWFNYIINSNFDVLMVTTNYKQYLINYALNQIRIQKLKTLI